MSEELHVVYRHVGPSSWEAYSRPVSIHSDGRTLEDARDEFAAAAEFHFAGQWNSIVTLEHIERQVAPGVFVRTAIDRHLLDRDQVMKVLRASLTVPAQVELLENSGVPIASTGDVVFVACVDSDPMPWLASQLGRADAFQVACLRGSNAVWWMPLASAGADLTIESESLAEAGLSSPTSTVADLMKVDHEPISVPLPDTAPTVNAPPAASGNRAARRRKGVRGKQPSALVHPRRRAIVAA